ncbi:hypothetical protein [Bacillus sp. FJAT-45066]|uniref:hypothetical protein n=1 Tax=Bacillus sp. FJAT-45066 TaxID=2011010 RepID=UPI000BB6E262|nr:hypothetical protein [Bacillus sp. FJAT-45066]
MRMYLLLVLLFIALIISTQTSSSFIAKPMEKRNETSYLIKTVPTESFLHEEKVVEVTAHQREIVQEIDRNFSSKLEKIELTYAVELVKIKEKLREYQTAALTVTSSKQIATTYNEWTELVEEEKMAYEELFDEWENELKKNNLPYNRVIDYRKENARMKNYFGNL